MANQFVLPSHESFTYLCGREVRNKAINLSLCIAIEKDRFKRYPDNKGKPCIYFYFEQGSKESWVYLFEDERDLDFDRIIKSNATQEDN